MAMVKQETSQALAPSQAPTPMMMLQAAVERGTDMDQLTKLMDLQERWEKNEARKQYMEAVAAFKKDPPKVVKDMLNKQYGSKYTSLANLVNTVNETLSTFGLNARWDFEQNEKITVTCILSHVAGHSERVSLSGQPDTSGSKNPIQQVKSTITYLKGATFEAITGIASQEANLDDDGNGAGKPVEKISENQWADLNTMLTDTKSDVSKFCQLFKIEKLDDLPASEFGKAINKLKQKAKKLEQEAAK